MTGWNLLAFAIAAEVVVTTTESVRTRSGEVAAEAKAVLVARDEEGRARPLNDAGKSSLAA